MQKNFRTLELAIELHQRLTAFKLPYYQKDQLNRASQSVALNLAEGAARFSTNEKRRFYQIAFGSLRETQTIMKIAGIHENETVVLADKTAASLYKLICATKVNLPLTVSS